MIVDVVSTTVAVVVDVDVDVESSLVDGRIVVVVVVMPLYSVVVLETVVVG